MEIEHLVGTMIEIPRAALTADEIAKSAEFFSFGTNDTWEGYCGINSYSSLHSKQIHTHTHKCK